MSSWGTGIKQSDEFMDVYDEFFELYKDDAVAIEIYQTILNEYQQEFSDEESSPMLYTVYYALAQCLWECGVKDDWLWQKIKDIIDTDADLRAISVRTTADTCGTKAPEMFVPVTVCTTAHLVLCICLVFGIVLRNSTKNDYNLLLSLNNCGFAIYSDVR